MNFKFLHIADVHLDTPFKNKDLHLRSYLRESIRKAFESCIDIALYEKVHAVLIAGDLFDQHTFSFATEKFLIEQAKRLNEAKIKMFYAHGNHDPYTVIHRKIAWPENVRIFGTGRPEKCAVTDMDGRTIAIVCGAGHESEREYRNLAQEFPGSEGGIPHIGLIHTMVHGAAGYGEHDVYAPCTLEDLRGRGYAYWALGHIHKQSIIADDPLTVYPGNLMGRNFSEDGPKGAYLVEISSDGKACVEFEEVAPVNWVTFTVDGISDCSDIGSLEDRIQASVIRQLEKYNNTRQLVPRIVLKGPCPLMEELQKEEEIETLVEVLKGRLSFNFLEVYANEVVRSIEPDKYRNGPHVLGTVLSIYDRLNLDDEFLLNLMGSDKLAGIAASASCEDKVKYLRSLLCGLDYEITDRITGGSKK